MTDEQRKRIHDITYSTQDRMELAEHVVALEDENARLRELGTGDRDWCPMQLSGVARCEGPDPALKAENDKLREFAKAAWRVMTQNEPLWVWKDMEADARELGIEEEQ